MKKNHNQLDQEHHKNIEILKAVAQAWHGHSTISKQPTDQSTSEFDARRRHFRTKPSRFKIEATCVSSAAKKLEQCGTSWDFRKSLWDSYEIVSVSRKLEMDLVMDGLFPSPNGPENAVKRPKESKNSLRSLFSRVSSRRFS